MRIGDTGTEQFSISTRVNGKLVKAQPIHDPFVTNCTRLRGFRHAWNALTRGITIQIQVDGTHGAVRAVMSLDPAKIEEDTQVFLEHQAQCRAANNETGVYGFYATQGNK